MKLHHDIAAVLPRIADEDMYKFCVWYEKYAAHLPTIATGLYDRLNAEDQARFLVWFFKRWAHIDLTNSVEYGLYNNAVERVLAQERTPHVLNGKMYGVLDFAPQGYEFDLLCYDWVTSVDDVLYNQYEHGDVALAPGDVIIDAGGFIGDTAVLFHHKLGGQCQIHSFELLDENLALLLHNLERNGVTSEQIVVNKLALTNETGGEIVLEPGVVQGAGSIFGKQAAGERIQTVTLDDYVVGAGIAKVDFIKMDIEGAEVMALNGAHRTIQLFKPRLAICLYHKWDDAVTIPQAILATGVDYEFSFKWVEMNHGWEAILFASPASSSTSSRHTSSTVLESDHLADALAVLTSSYIKKCVQADGARQLSEKPRAMPAAKSA